MHCYAQIKDGKVVAVLKLAGEVDDPRYVPIQEHDPELIGAVWDGSNFVQGGGQCLFVHVQISGGDGDEPPGIALGGQEAFVVAVTVRSGPEADAPIVPLSGAWRITLRRSSGSEGEVLRVRLTDGEASFTWAPHQQTAPGTYCVSEADFAAVEHDGIRYEVRLAQPVIFKLYREV